MANISLTIDMSEFEKFAKTAPEKVARAIQNTIYKITLMIERGGKQNAPVDTGRLRVSIASDIRPMQASVRTNTNYASYVHDGTRYIRARPFLGDAVEQVSHQVEDIVLDELKTLD